MLHEHGMTGHLTITEWAAERIQQLHDVGRQHAGLPWVVPLPERSYSHSLSKVVNL